MEHEMTVTDETLLKYAQDWIPQEDITQIKNDIFDVPNQLQLDVVKNIHPYMVIRAGCGEGKTGAALSFARYWIKNQQAKRMIITLPTRFSVNSMYLDLQYSDKYNFPSHLVGVYHAEASKLLTTVKDQQEDSKQSSSPFVADQLFRNTFYQPLITVSTIDHLLYSLIHSHKYSDRAFGNILQSIVIFDEIHYYERFTLQKIVECLRILKLLQVPHLLMSATLPESFLKQMNQIGKKNPYIFLTSEGRTPDQKKIKKPFQICKATTPLYHEKTKLSSYAKEIVGHIFPIVK